RVAEAVLERLDRASASAPALARAVAILGDGSRLADAAALVGLDERVALDTASAMRASELFSDATGLAFSHPIIRAAIYQSVLPAERVLRHAEAARLLHERGAPAGQIAAQILSAEGVRFGEAWAAAQLRLAGDAAMGMGAPRSAIAYLTRALELAEEDGERAALVARLGHAEALAGLAAGRGHLEEAIRLAADPDDRGRAAIMLAQVLKFSGDAAQSVVLLSGIGAVRDPDLQQRLDVELLSAALVSRAAHESLEERIASLGADTEPARTPRERLERVILAFERMLDNAPVAETREMLRSAGPPPGLDDTRIVLAPGVVTRGAVLMYCEELEAATAMFDELVQRARASGSMTSLVLGLSLRAEASYRRGDLAAGLADATSACELSREVTTPSAVLLLQPTGVINSVAVEQERSVADLERLLAQTDEHLEGDFIHASGLHFSRAQLLLALGRTEAALAQLATLEALGRTFYLGVPTAIPWRSTAALIHQQLGDDARARRLADEELVLSRAMGAPRAVGVSLRACALTRDPVDLDALQEAVAVLSRSPARLEHARALIDLGAARRRSGERAASREPLREGHDLAMLCAATALAARARDEIAATGARVAPSGLTGVASLTPSERRVAELAAQGQSNRDIAQSLFITEKTVETHLGHVYDKLGVRSRHKLDALLPVAAPVLA
ncbi:MAG TPA: LuxR C-terminal-related transcriptional regulator, partial [Solirubrobacteraceae bacterium]|nr:LuxR C-terminal-related transcriptional regulator [Solirubrobacteraceae bacterium]